MNVLTHLAALMPVLPIQPSVSLIPILLFSMSSLFPFSDLLPHLAQINRLIYTIFHLLCHQVYAVFSWYNGNEFRFR